MSFYDTLINEDFYRTGGEHPVRYPPNWEKTCKDWADRQAAREEKNGKVWERKARVERFKVALMMSGYPKDRWPEMFKLNGIPEEET
jgi:hypothetical protein